MSRILIVDDVGPSRDALAKLLRRDGYETTVASNGADALARIKTNLPDLILLDHMMPEVDGLTFLAGIRRFPKWKNLPVIMFSGLKDRQCIMKAQVLGVVAYLVKSEYTVPQLMEHIRKHLPPTPPVPAEMPKIVPAPAM